jgi:hypothetical protein
MRAKMPLVILEGDNENQVGTTRPFLMARNGTLMGMSRGRAVWRFGMLPNSEAALAYGFHSEDFTWVLSERQSGKVISSWQGPAIRMPDEFRSTLNWGDEWYDWQ